MWLSRTLSARCMAGRQWERRTSTCTFWNAFSSVRQHLWTNRATLTPGNYTPTELATEIQTKMNAVSFFGPSAYTVSYSTSLQNMTISVGFPGDATYTQYHGFQIVSSKILADPTFQAYGNTKLIYNANGIAYPSSSPTAYSADLNDPQSADGLLSLDYDKTDSDAVSALMTIINDDSSTSAQWPKSHNTLASWYTVQWPPDTGTTEKVEATCQKMLKRIIHDK